MRTRELARRSSKPMQSAITPVSTVLLPRGLHVLVDATNASPPWTKYGLRRLIAFGATSETEANLLISSVWSL